MQLSISQLCSFFLMLAVLSCGWSAGNLPVCGGFFVSPAPVLVFSCGAAEGVVWADLVSPLALLGGVVAWLKRVGNALVCGGLKPRVPMVCSVFWCAIKALRCD